MMTHGGILRIVLLHVMKHLTFDQIPSFHSLGYIHLEISKDRHDIQILSHSGSENFNLA